MTHSKAVLSSISAVLFSVLTFASSAKADCYQHIDDLALDIQAKTGQLLQETAHYRYTPQYRKLVACTSEMYRLAEHIHEVARFEGDVRHLQADLRDLEYEFHQLEDLFDRVELSAARGCSRIKGNTAHVKRLLNRIEDCIDEIQEDVDRLVRRSARRPVTVRQPVYVPATPVYVPERPFCGADRDRHINRGTHLNLGYSNHYSRDPRNFNVGSVYGNHRVYSTRNIDNGLGFSIGGGSSRIQIRF